jgi:hypothetical protein
MGFVQLAGSYWFISQSYSCGPTDHDKPKFLMERSPTERVLRQDIKKMVLVGSMQGINSRRNIWGKT